jgi:uncharacterized phage-associated protein
MRRYIRFRFEPEKLVQALAFFASHGVRDLTKMKAAKLLFFADKYHLLRYGRPVIGDQYACMDYGAVPSVSLNVMNDVIADDPQNPPVEKALFAKYIDVSRFGRKNPVFRAKKQPDLDVFSASDVEALNYAVEKYGGKSTAELSAETHKDPAWCAANERRRPGSSVMMDYQMFFEGESERMLEQVEAEQEDRDFAEALNW